jgi:serine phosphatase RsbU (regulator of sigma subunit)
VQVWWQLIPNIAGEAGDMTIKHLPHRTDVLPIIICESAERRIVASYKRKLTAYRQTEIRLWGALARSEILLRQTDELIQNQAVLSEESDRRLLNDRQVIVNLLPLQNWASANAEVAFAEYQTSERV